MKPKTDLVSYQYVDKHISSYLSGGGAGKRTLKSLAEACGFDYTQLSNMRNPTEKTRNFTTVAVKALAKVIPDLDMRKFALERFQELLENTHENKAHAQLFEEVVKVLLPSEQEQHILDLLERRARELNPKFPPQLPDVKHDPEMRRVITRAFDELLMIEADTACDPEPVK